MADTARAAEEADALFTRKSVRDIEAYASELSRGAKEKQHTVRALVGDHYGELLGVARTVVDMQKSIIALQHVLRRIPQLQAHYETHAARHAAAIRGPNAPSSLPYGAAACTLLLASAPEIVQRTMQRGAFVHAAWTVAMAERAAVVFRDTPQTRPDAAFHDPRRTLTQRAASHLGEGDAGHVLELLAVLIALGEQEILALYLAERLAFLQRDSAPRLVPALQRALSLFCDTLAIVHSLFSSRGNKASPLATMLAAWQHTHDNTTAFFQLGMPLLHAIVPPDCAPLLVHLPHTLRAYAPAYSLPSASEIARQSDAWCESARAAILAILAPLVQHTDELDTIAAARHLLHSDTPHAAALCTELGTLLDTQTERLLASALAQLTTTFRAVLGEAVRHMEDPPLDAPLDAPAWGTAELARCVDLLEARLHAMEAHASTEALARAWDTVAADLDAAAASAHALPAQSFLLRLCAKLVDMRGSFFAPLHARAAARCVGAQVRRALAVYAKAQGAEAPMDAPSAPLFAALLSLSRAQLHVLHARPADPLPTFLDAYSARDAIPKAQQAWDAEFLALLARRPCSNDSVLAAAQRLRLVLPPWTLVHAPDSKPTARPARGIQAARAAPRVGFP
ncbi:hypothetical protein MVES1_003951 [Malassezia vespertilionis]|uniref:uncharacterized protein n=1 Tax=Malassezia vespertilionis TaxID=2020962 RepID=UPI0024B0A2E8|nr:uncharacterized protein MVES1_003951 [Malassezia vespertilionis]WFD08575.1 hypothetical protein MVES1_003951 [Malassezia vespertilionis]